MFFNNNKISIFDLCIRSPWSLWSNFLSPELIGTLLARKIKSVVRFNLTKSQISDSMEKVQDNEGNWKEVYKTIHHPKVTLSKDMCDDLFHGLTKFNGKINKVVKTLKRHQQYAKKIEMYEEANVSCYKPHKNDVKQSVIENILHLCSTREEQPEKFTYSEDESTLERHYTEHDTRPQEMGFLWFQIQQKLLFVNLFL